MNTILLELQMQHQQMENASAILISLTEKFDKPDRVARFDLMRQIIQCQMTGGSSVHMHVSSMINLMDRLDLLGGGINAEAKVDIILNSLLKAFDGFKVNTVMGKKEYTLNELLNDLVTTEGLLGKNEKGLISTKTSNVPSK